MKIGVFDSGIGGLSVLKSLISHKLFQKIVYFGDTARVPYGTKDKNTIIKYSLEALEFFKSHNIDMLITACNSVSAYAIEELNKKADFKVAGVITAGVMALKNKIKNKDSKILIIGTKATIDSKKYQKLLNQEGFYNIIAIQTGLFVPLIEEGILDGKILDDVIKYYFKDIVPDEIDSLILGCTHFPLIQNQLQKYFKNATIIHSGEAIVEYLQKEFHISQIFDNTDIEYFASDNLQNLKLNAKKWLD